MFWEVCMSFAVFKSPRQGTSSLLTIMSIGRCLLNYFSSLLNSFTAPPVVCCLCNFVPLQWWWRPFFLFLYCSVHAIEAGLKAEWMDGENKEARQCEFEMMSSSSSGCFQGQGRMKCKQEFARLEPLTLWGLGGCSGNLSCPNLCVHSHLVCQHSNWLLLLKLAQRITWSLVFILSLRSTFVRLGSDLKETQGTTCLLFLS